MQKNGMDNFHAVLSLFEMHNSFLSLSNAATVLRFLLIAHVLFQSKSFFTFNGTSFVLFYTQYTKRGTVEVYVDNVLQGTINTNGALVWQKTWSSPNLGAAVHTVKFVHAAGSVTEVDAIHQVNGP